MTAHSLHNPLSMLFVSSGILTDFDQTLITMNNYMEFSTFLVISLLLLISIIVPPSNNCPI